MVPWKRIGVALKAGQVEALPLLMRVLEAVRARGLEPVLDREAATRSGAGDGFSLERVAERVDLFVVLGGDGTVLATARAIGVRNVPILGINLGHLGFMADVAPDDVDAALASVFEGRYVIEERARLEVTCVRDEHEVDYGQVLNDAVFGKRPDIARLIAIDTRLDGKPLVTYRADGLIVSTPTGSTAYNLSAGGPLLDPALEAMILTPICPHALSQRPLVLATRRVVEVHASGDPLQLTIDGQIGRVLNPGEHARITRSPYPMRFVTLPDHDHFATVRAKLGWGAS